MNQTIRVIGEQESSIRRSLLLEGEQVIRKAGRAFHIHGSLYAGIFFAPMAEKNHLGHFTIPDRFIILSEDLLEYPPATIRNVFLHECAHALDYAIHGHSTGHGAEFREYCRVLGMDEGFDKATIRKSMEDREKTEGRIRKLLALSSSPFENESLQALSKAQKLIREMEANDLRPNGRDDKIYEVDLYEAGRMPLYITRLLSFTQKATGVCVVKCQGEEGSHIARAYGSLEETEAALYLFQSLLDAVENEVGKLRKKGAKVTKDSFVIGAVPEMEKKLFSYDASSSTELMVIQNQNLRKAKRLVFKEASLRSTHSRGHITSPESYRYGQQFGKDVDIEKRPGTKKITS